MYSIVWQTNCSETYTNLWSSMIRLPCFQFIKGEQFPQSPNFFNCISESLYEKPGLPICQSRIMSLLCLTPSINYRYMWTKSQALTVACKSPLFSLCLSLPGSRLSNHTCLLSLQDMPNSCQPRPCYSATVVLLPTPPLRSQHGLHLFRGSGPSLVIPCFHSFPSQFIFTYYLLVYFALPRPIHWIVSYMRVGMDLLTTVYLVQCLTELVMRKYKNWTQKSESTFFKAESIYEYMSLYLHL